MQVNWIRPHCTLHKPIRLLSFQIEITIWLTHKKIAINFGSEHTIKYMRKKSACFLCLSNRPTCHFHIANESMLFDFFRYSLFITAFRLVRGLLFMYAFIIAEYNGRENWWDNKNETYDMYHSYTRGIQLQNSHTIFIALSISKNKSQNSYL